MSMAEKINKRRRGAAIIETTKGVMLVARDDSDFMIPGGGANFLETRKRAAIREVYEELGLKVKNAKYIFDYVGPVHISRKGKLRQNFAKVFLLETIGKPKPANEITRVAYWKPGSKLKLMGAAKTALEKYVEWKKSN
jgi:8-oxo-dGTP pyrophosphatase MutT (NUDIX family)